MGKVEKVVVLSVLFLITLILVVSLSSSPESPSQHEERMASRGPRATDLGADLAVDPLAMPEVQPVSLPAERLGAPALLSTVVDPRGEAARLVQADPVASPGAANAPANGLPDGSILVTTEGLDASYLPEYRFYTWTAGDSWDSVAQHCYGSSARVALLRQENEGRSAIQPGEKILVPVFAPGSSHGAPSTRPRGPANAGAPPTSPAVVAGGYVVVEGDSLWKISKRVYGSGARWQEIYAANRDLLPSPDSLATGQRLRIP